MDEKEILQIEKGFWGGDESYFNENTHKEATFVFPNIKLDKQKSVEGIKNNPRWDELEVKDIEFSLLSNDAGLLTYRATGKRNESVPYNAQITSIYKKENGEPKLFFHQHTPDKED